MQQIPFCLAVVLFGAWSLTHAADYSGPTHNVVSLQAEASSEVANDTLVAILSARAEGSQAAPLADQVNRSVNWAIAQAKAIPEVTVATQGYQTSPVYRKNTLTGWRVSQAIRLESQETTRMSELVAKLQQQLQVTSIDFQLSNTAKRQAHDGLIAQAIERFTTRAQLITRNFGRSNYRLVRLDVNTGQAPPPRPILMQTMARSAEAVAVPEFEGGNQRIAVTLTGSIELTDD